ncbi:MAG: aldolase/citrate lyase family protein [Methylobacter sp.]|uniref:aldolase/citrate lyase family protein n=1 Tax=Methylobacter sp. TaxID=2051955 RepID=UPI002731283F|nr:aldolase/citrate lyase family protein [Methylobacter sp.]MDP1664048.1 aldolase/citrate lyase family protein [Methylobacter sp.]
MTSFGDKFKLTLITNDPVLAATADRCGVNRVGVDLEYLGKTERQQGHDTRFSNHQIKDVARIGRCISKAKLFVRLNPINAKTSIEIEEVLHSGANVLMLPFFRTPQEVEKFVRLVDGRAHLVILLETASALVRVREILAIPGLQEVMVGLNDLRIELAVNNHFEVLASSIVDTIAWEANRAGLAFSVGGVARPDDQSLSIDPNLVLAQYPRLGATGAWISRSFFHGMPSDWDFEQSVLFLRKRLTEWSETSPELREEARKKLADMASEMARQT